MLEHFFGRSNELRQNVQRAFLQLSAEGYEQGTHYATIGAQQGCYGGLGISLSGACTPSVAREIGSSLIDLPFCTLFYLHPTREGALYAGPIAQNEKQWIAERSQEAFNRQQQAELATSFSEPQSFDYQENTFELALRLRKILNEVLEGADTDVDLERDSEGLSAFVEEIPDREAAIAVQRRIIREIEEFEFCVRFESEPENWKILALDKAPFR